MKSESVTCFQSKTVENFAQAVVEICADFDESQKGQETCKRDERSGSDQVSEAAVHDGREDYDGSASGKDRNNLGGSKNYEGPASSKDGTDLDEGIPEIKRNGLHDVSMKFDHSSPRQDDVDDQDKKPSTSTPIRRNSATLIFYVRKKKRKIAPKEAASTQDELSCCKRETLPYSEQPIYPKQDEFQREMMNCREVDDVANVLDRYEGPNEKPRSNSRPVISIGEDGKMGCRNLANSTDQLKYQKKGKVASYGNKEASADDMWEMRKVKRPSKDKNISETVKDAVVTIAETVHFQSKISEEKHIVLGLGRRPSPVSGNRRVEKRKVAKECLNKRTMSSLAVADSLGGNVGKQLVNKDERKRRLLVIEAMPDSADSSADDTEKRPSPESKPIIENAVLHVQKKKRAVVLFDEDDDECPRTPIHGGPPKKLDSSDSSQKTIATRFNGDQGSAAKPTWSEATRKKELSPTKSNNPHVMTKQIPELQKPSKYGVKCSDTGSERKASPMSSKSPLLSSGGFTSHQDHSTSLKVRQTSSRERPKNNTRLENGDEDIKTLESVLSMKHLIAAAQAKRKQTNIANSIAGVSNISTLASLDSLERNPVPSSNQPVLTSASSLEHKDAPDLNQQRKSKSSPAPAYVSESRAEAETAGDKKIKSGHRGSLSSGTEAAVARDAFEGMIETLSRTKESIRRATRLAIDCAKYGIAHEVVDLLVCKLESEPSLHRKVDLFFLVDSITQRSHSHKGIAGASYIPTVQAALPRLLSAAAPVNSGGAENRRQCLKVLRLWLERKIFPKSFLRSCMDDVGTSNSSTMTLRRLSRVERAVDDPLREMEGVLVDEYGSNAAFQLPGLLSSRAFEEEDDEEEHEELRTHHGEGSLKACPVQATTASVDQRRYDGTPSDGYHYALKDVDGDFEKEDSSQQPKNEKDLIRRGNGMESKKLGITRMEESADGIAPGVFILPVLSSSFPEHFPPLPPDSPPPTPALPYSPPPFPPPTTIPPSSPAATAQLPFPPEPTPGVLPRTLPHQSSMPFQSTVGPQPFMANHAGQISGGLLADAGMKTPVMQHSCFFAPVGKDFEEPSGINARQRDYGMTETCSNKVSWSNRLSLSGDVLSAQRSHQVRPAQNVSAPYAYTHPWMHPHQPNSYSHSYS